MPLKIKLSPNEKILIGGAVIKNGGSQSEFVIENNVPILRQKNILTEKTANTPCKKVYLLVQLMYIDEKNFSDYQKLYWNIVKEILTAAPSFLPLIDKINHMILKSDYYNGLKEAQKLIEYEAEVLKNATK